MKISNKLSFREFCDSELSDLSKKRFASNIKMKISKKLSFREFCNSELSDLCTFDMEIQLRQKMRSKSERQTVS